MTGEEKEPITNAEIDTATTTEPVQPQQRVDLEDEFRLKVGNRLGEVSPPARRPFFQTSKGLGLLSAGVVITVLAAFLLAGRHEDPPPSSPQQVNIRYVPQRQDVVNGKVAIKAGELVQYPINIQPEMYEANLKGSFEGADGGDLIAIVAEDSAYQNWINGRPSQFLWGTEKARTSGTFDIALRPGTYHLVLSNKFSAHSNKMVSLEAVLNFKRSETY